MADDGRPSIGWIERNQKFLAVLAVVGVGLSWLFTQVNPDTVMNFRVEQEKRACEVRIHAFIDRGKFCHMNMNPSARWMCWTAAP